MSEICVACNRYLTDFVDVPCTQCAYQHDEMAPEEGQPLNFNADTYYDKMHSDEPAPDGTMGIWNQEDEE